MFKKKVSMEEFVQAIYLLGWNQYNNLTTWFNAQNIEVNNNTMFFLCELIITKVMEKVSKEKGFKIKGNLTDEITQLLNKSISPEISFDDKNYLKEYILVVKDDIRELIDDGNRKIIDLVDFFLDEISYNEVELDNIRVFLVNLFSDWQGLCYELISKIKII